MRLDGDDARKVLAETWERWAQRCGELAEQEWSTPTRCRPWDVKALVAHVCPDPAMFDMLAQAVVDEPAALTDAAAMLRRFNEPDGIAHTSAEGLADRALADAANLTPEDAINRFTKCARILRARPMPENTVITYPTVGTTTLAVIAEMAVMEATVHLLDLTDAVGGVEPSPEALVATRDLLIAVPDPTAAVEALAGRADAAVAVPAIR
jgi:hypothetical protein